MVSREVRFNEHNDHFQTVTADLSLYLSISKREGAKRRRRERLPSTDRGGLLV
jgi:hypothetical protein